MLIVQTKLNIFFFLVLFVEGGSERFRGSAVAMKASAESGNQALGWTTQWHKPFLLQTAKSSYLV